MKTLLVKNDCLYKADVHTCHCVTCGKKWLLVDDHSKDYGVCTAFTVWADVTLSHVLACAINKSTEDSVKELKRIIE